MKPFPEVSVAERRRARSILTHLARRYPVTGTALHHENPFQLLVATILSAQCTDERVNRVTPDLFRRFPGPAEFAVVPQEMLEREIRSTGFYRMKAGHIIACSGALLERYGGRVPRTLDELVLLPGVGRKTANVVLGHAFGVAAGVVVDTHVQRLARRLGLSGADTPAEIEKDLMRLYPQTKWIALGSALILHGRTTCRARKPACHTCILAPLCPAAAAGSGG